MLEKKDSLPRPEGKPTAMHGDYFTRAGQGHTQMAGAVVSPLTSVNEKRKRLGDEKIEKSMQISPGLGIGVFHDHETRAGMPHKDGKLPGLDSAFFDKIRELPRDFVSALSPRRY